MYSSKSTFYRSWSLSRWKKIGTRSRSKKDRLRNTGRGGAPWSSRNCHYTSYFEYFQCFRSIDENEKMAWHGPKLNYPLFQISQSFLKCHACQCRRCLILMGWCPAARTGHLPPGGLQEGPGQGGPQGGLCRGGSGKERESSYLKSIQLRICPLFFSFRQGVFCGHV